MARSPDAGLPHIGALLRHVRHARDLRQLDVVHLSGLSAATVARLEAWGRSSEASFEAYVDGLVRAPGPLALRPDQAAFLRELRVHDQHRADGEALLAAVDAVAASDPSAQAGLADLLATLKAEARPAVLVDPVFRILALNRPLLGLLGLADGEETLREPSAWHVLASSLDARSPFHAHVASEDFLASTVSRFFHATAPFLFTNPFRRLLAWLESLAPELFAPLWHQASSLSIPDTRGEGLGVIDWNDYCYLYVAKALASRDVELLPGRAATYTLFVLDPAGPPVPAHLIAGPVDGPQAIFAHQYLTQDDVP